MDRGGYRERAVTKNFLGSRIQDLSDGQGLNLKRTTYVNTLIEWGVPSCQNWHHLKNQQFSTLNPYFMSDTHESKMTHPEATTSK